MTGHVSIRGLVLAAELTSARQRAGLTTRQAARQIGISSAGLNRSETGQRLASVEEVGALLAVYGINGSERERLVSLSRDAAARGWWQTGDRTAHAAALMTLERKTRLLFEYAPVVVPDLLQTPAYAACGTAGSDTDGDQRRKRQVEFVRKQRVSYLAVVDEAVLRRPVGGPQVMAEQIRHLVAAMDHPHIRVHVLPLRHGGYPASGAFSLYELGNQATVVYLGSQRTTAFLDHPDDTGPYEDAVGPLVGKALGPGESRQLMERIAADHDHA